MGRYLRSKRLRAALWLAAEGKCQRCGIDLPPGWHADHVTPWSVTGQTNVFDMQALCGRCNASKGDSMDLTAKVARAHQLCDQIQRFAEVLRKHQAETLRLLRGIASGVGGGDWPHLTSPGFMVQEIVPGGGKSFNAVMSASVLVGSGLFDCAVWISPRLTLIQQAKDDFADVGLALLKYNKRFPIFNPAGLAPREVPADASKMLDPAAKVWVLPYQRLNGIIDYLGRMAESRNVLLIFDEFQLLRDLSGPTADNSESWFSSLAPIVDACQRRTGFGGIILSGGLYRNDGRRLPCIGYRPGDPALWEDPKKMFPMSDVRYTLSEGQEDRCITKIDMDFYNGEITFRSEDDVSVENIHDMEGSLYNHKLTLFLEKPEVWQVIISDMLASLDEFNPPWQGYRARYMVTSKSIADAEMHAEFLESIGRRPLLVHSGQSGPDKKRLDEFRLDRGDWDGLVSVAMGYIGLSIKNLTHMAYLSHYRSAAWINQAFHRVTRTDNNPKAPPYQNQLARIFLPNDPQMRAMADQIMRDQNPGVRDMPRPPAPTRPLGYGCGDEPEFEGLDASITGREFNSNNEHCTKHDFIDQAVRTIPLLNQLPRRVVEDFKTFTDQYGDE